MIHIDQYRFGSASPFGGYSWEFNGSDEYIEIPDDSSLSFGNGSTDSAFSVSFWVKKSINAPASYFSKGLTTTSNFEYYIDTDGGGDPRLLMYDESSNGFIAASINGTAWDWTNADKLNNWYLWVITYDGSGSNSGITWYVDGSSKATTTASAGSYTAMENLSGTVKIARYGTKYFDGQMADVIVWDTELTSGNVTSIYNSGTPRDERNEALSGNIVSFWQGATTADGAGGVPDDGGANTNDGTLTNMTVATNVLADYP